MDYGHPLSFGVTITPTNADPSLPVHLARRSEQAGLDLVTFQDHPYQPAFHDTWTLLGWVAGQTERIGLAPNVLNVPMRQPAVLEIGRASGRGRGWVGGAGGRWLADQ